MIPATVSIREAARALGLAYETVRLMTVAGEFPGAVQVKGRWRIPVAEVARMLRPVAAPPITLTPRERADRLAAQWRNA